LQIIGPSRSVMSVIGAPNRFDLGQILTSRGRLCLEISRLNIVKPALEFERGGAQAVRAFVVCDFVHGCARQCAFGVDSAFAIVMSVWNHVVECRIL
jgi:hypothetical protein